MQRLPCSHFQYTLDFKELKYQMHVGDYWTDVSSHLASYYMNCPIIGIIITN